MAALLLASYRILSVAFSETLSTESYNQLTCATYTHSGTKPVIATLSVLP